MKIKIERWLRRLIAEELAMVKTTLQAERNAILALIATLDQQRADHAAVVVPHVELSLLRTENAQLRDLVLNHVPAVIDAVKKVLSKVDAYEAPLRHPLPLRRGTVPRRAPQTSTVRIICGLSALRVSEPQQFLNELRQLCGIFFLLDLFGYLLDSLVVPKVHGPTA